MNLDILNSIQSILPVFNASTGMDMEGLKYVGAAFAVLTGFGSGIGEGNICTKAVEGMARNPEMYTKLRTAMILGCALDETTGIYGLVIAILCLVM